MTSILIFISVAGLVLAIGGMAVLTPRLLTESKSRRQTTSAHHHTCPNCQHAIELVPGRLRGLDANEAALVIQNVPNAPPYDLGDIRCPGCQSALVFRTDQWPPVYLAVNILQGHTAKNICTQCRTPLERPDFPKGAFDQDNDALGKLRATFGLICSRCDAVNCVSCVQQVTRNRTEDGSMLCPRCYRGPVDKVHHF